MIRTVAQMMGQIMKPNQKPNWSLIHIIPLMIPLKHTSSLATRAKMTAETTGEN
jgi:hypothetical protein